MLGEASIIDNGISISNIAQQNFLCVIFIGSSFRPDIIVDDDEVESNLKAKFEKLRKEQYVAAMQSLMDDDDFSDSDM